MTSKLIHEPLGSTLISHSCHCCVHSSSVQWKIIANVLGVLPPVFSSE